MRTTTLRFRKSPWASARAGQTPQPHVRLKTPPIQLSKNPDILFFWPAHWARSSAPWASSNVLNQPSNIRLKSVGSAGAASGSCFGARAELSCRCSSSFWRIACWSCSARRPLSSAAACLARSLSASWPPSDAEACTATAAAAAAAPPLAAPSKSLAPSTTTIRSFSSSSLSLSTTTNLSFSFTTSVSLARPSASACSSSRATACRRSCACSSSRATDRCRSCSCFLSSCACCTSRCRSARSCCSARAASSRSRTASAICCSAFSWTSLASASIVLIRSWKSRPCCRSPSCSSPRSRRSSPLCCSSSACLAAACRRSSWSSWFRWDVSARTASRRLCSAWLASNFSWILPFSSSSSFTASSTFSLCWSCAWSCLLCFVTSAILASRAACCFCTASFSSALAVTRLSRRARSASPVFMIFSTRSARFARSSSSSAKALASASCRSTSAFSFAMPSSRSFSASVSATTDWSRSFSSAVLATWPSSSSLSTVSTLLWARAASRSASAVFSADSRASRCLATSWKRRSVFFLDSSSFASCALSCWASPWDSSISLLSLSFSLEANSRSLSKRCFCCALSSCLLGLALPDSVPGEVPFRSSGLTLATSWPPRRPGRDWRGVTAGPPPRGVVAAGLPVPTPPVQDSRGVIHWSSGPLRNLSICSEAEPQPLR
mmetsp:Transcript_72748/g.196785  ORF Transcript_72748/g.196785 Transcript_72748/m.196785 type:complete len:666 (+) Transcript_72748:194-2191(+)